jgi:putative CocE/NonD family hydrolase
VTLETSTGSSAVPREIERLLIRGVDTPLPAARYRVQDIRTETVWVPMRDGVKLATDLYLPPVATAPVVVMRTPYDRAPDKFLGAFYAFARRGYAVVSQDCRATGESEPDVWDFYIYESDDSVDTIEWITQQEWYGGFIGSLGGSYVGQTQWCMAVHPAMSTIVPEVSGLGVAINTTHLHLFVDAYDRSVGKGFDKLPVHFSETERLLLGETLASGYFNEPLQTPFSAALHERFPWLGGMPHADAQRRLWEEYCALPSTGRVEFLKEALGVRNITFTDMEKLPPIFGQRISIDSHTVPHPDHAELARMIQAPPLLSTGWYDWGINDALATWELMRREGRPDVAERTRLLIAPSAHNMPGYHEGVEDHPELLHNHRSTHAVGVLLAWYEAVREGTTDAWPDVLYYLMGANEWRAAEDWPVPGTTEVAWYLGAGGVLSTTEPTASEPDRYTYDPEDPTPTVGGAIVSYVYPPGSVDVSGAQARPDVLVYTSEPLAADLDVVGPLRMVLYASSSALDTDFVARLSDVFPDGRAIELQSNILRARFRDIEAGPQLLEPGRIYRFEIDLWATANRFAAGHRIRVDISSADFPHYDRNTNLGGEPGAPVPAHQAVYHDPEHPSHLVVSVLAGGDR